jgi:hypothetical protein
MNTLFVIDIDQCISDASRRLVEAGPEPDRSKDVSGYNTWLSLVQNEKSILEDKAVPGMKELVSSLPIRQCIYLTARGETYLKVTTQWLRDNKFPRFELIMRPQGNTDRSDTFKAKMIRIAKAHYGYDNVVVIDDDQRDELRTVCYLEGYTFLKAYPGVQK